MNPHVDQFEFAYQVVEWCKQALIHENNPSKDVHRCVCIYRLYTHDIFIHIQKNDFQSCSIEKVNKLLSLTCLLY